MEVKVKYFGMIAEKMGVTENTVNIDNHNKENLNDFFINEYPFLENFNFQIAVNHTLSNSINDITEDATIALLPPFAGG